MDAIDITKRDPQAPPAGAPAPVPAPASINPGGVVGKALALSAGVDQAADARLASDPVMPKILEQMKLLEGDYATAVPGMQARTQQINDLVAQEDPARPAIPRLKPLPAVPTLDEIATKQGIKPEDYNNPMRVFGQFMPVLVALGAGLVAKNGVAAIQAATAAMNAADAKDKAAYEKAHKEWLEETKATVDGNNQLLSEYRLIMDDRKAGMDEKIAKINALAAANKDGLTQAALRGGYIDQLQSVWQMRDKAAAPINDLVRLTMQDESNRRELEFRAALEWAKLEAERNPAYVRTDQVVGNILNKMARGDTLTDAEKAALVEAQRQREASSPTFGMPLGAAAAATPAAAGAAAQPASPATATAAPPASMLKEGVRTTFKNGQVWTLTGGKPTQLQ